MGSVTCDVNLWLCRYSIARACMNFELGENGPESVIVEIMVMVCSGLEAVADAHVGSRTHRRPWY